jgi:SAM-dependent methyltransferase
MYRYSDIARELAANVAMGIPAIKGRRVRKGRTIGVAANVKARSVLDQFNFFIEGIGWPNIQGKVIAEIGPGDAIPLAPLFLAAGAKGYIAVDRFLGEVHGAEACRLYRAVLEILPERLSSGLHGVCRAAGRKSVEDLLRLPDRVRLYRFPIEQPDDSIRAQADYVVSFNVCEHLADLPRAFRGMRSLLAPEGLMIHRVDYGPHDVWTTAYDNPLAFLTVPRPIWRAMTSNRGCPNRVRHAQLMAMARALGFECTERIGNRASSVAINEARPHLSSEFRSLSDDEVAVLDAEVICSHRNGHFNQSRRPPATAGLTA